MDAILNISFSPTVTKWHPTDLDSAPSNYPESVKKHCLYLNSRFSHFPPDYIACVGHVLIVHIWSLALRNEQKCFVFVSKEMYGFFHVHTARGLRRGGIDI